MKYSLIVPAYNAEKYIGRCLDSLLNQTYKNIEIIVVDDGSVDNTLAILKKYEKEYNSVKVYHQDNQGSLSARENGIKNAKGKFCLVMDADDWLELDAVNVLNDYINKFEEIDIVKFRSVLEPTGKKSPEYKPSGKVLNTDELIQLRRDLLLSCKYNNLSNQVFRKDLYNMVQVDDISDINYGEDLAVNLDLIGRAENVILINDVLYHYFENPESITHDIDVNNIGKNISDNIRLNKRRIDYLKIYNIDDISIDDIKCRSISFACDQIRKYLVTMKHPNYQLLVKNIEETGLTNFVSLVNLNKVPFMDKIMIKEVIAGRYGLLKFLRPCFWFAKCGKLLYSKIRVCKRLK